MLISFKFGQGSIILRVKLRNSSVATGAGLTGLTSASAGLIIATIADSEATATTYTATGSTIESIITLGTYVPPTTTKCRFKEVDPVNHKGVYEIQIADARFAVSNSKSLILSVSGALNLAECDAVIPLPAVDPYTPYVTLAPTGLDQITVETGVNFRQSQSLVLAAAGGVISGMGTTTVTVNAAGISPLVRRVSAVVDDLGNRITTLYLPA